MPSYFRTNKISQQYSKGIYPSPHRLQWLSPFLNNAVLCKTQRSLQKFRKQVGVGFSKTVDRATTQPQHLSSVSITGRRRGILRARRVEHLLRNSIFSIYDKEDEITEMQPLKIGLHSDNTSWRPTVGGGNLTRPHSQMKGWLQLMTAERGRFDHLQGGTP